MSKKKRIPSMLKHSSGQARVILSGKVFYLGVWGTPEAHAKYAELVRRWEENGRQPLVKVPTAVEVSYSISDLFKHYLEYLDETGRYTKNGKHTSQRSLIQVALTELETNFGKLRVHQFGEEHLLQHRDALEANPRLTRHGINRKVNLIKQAFRWGRQRGRVPKSVWLDLKAVEPLTRFECGNRLEGKPKKPVTRDQLNAVLPHCSRQVAAMLKLQWLTGMRPGEVCRIRWADIDQEPIVVDGISCWTYQVTSAKTSHHGRKTIYPLNPACQSILREFRKPPAAYIFSPQEVMVERSKKRREDRQTPITPSTLNSLLKKFNKHVA